MEHGTFFKSVSPGKMFIVLLLGWICLSPLVASQNATFALVKVNEAVASSTLEEKMDFGNAAASNALARGFSYWSSAKNLPSNEVVTWTGYLEESRTAAGIRILWENAPGKFMIETSFDGISFTVAVDWKKPEKLVESFQQDVLFPQPLKMSVFRISMENPLHDVFGINYCAVITDFGSLVMFVGGISSAEGDLCLQADGGSKTSGTPITLDGCIDAIAAGDGREIFRLNNENQIVHELSQLCVQLKDNDMSNNGEVILGSCALRDDHSNQWTIMADNRLKSMRPGDWCMTQEGSKAGTADVAFSKVVSTNYPRLNEPKHAAKYAVDGDSRTYWASQDFFFPDGMPPSVDFDVDLGGPYKMKSLKVQWEFPPSDYQVLTSQGDQEFSVIQEIAANVQLDTVDSFGGNIEGRFVKIRLLKPNIKHSVKEGKAIYGIRTLNVVVNRLRTKMELCEETSKSKDVREKYFPLYVKQFDSLPGSYTLQQTESTKKEFQSLNRMSDLMERQIEKYNDCRSSFEDKTARVARIQSELGEMKHRMHKSRLSASVVYDHQIPKKQESFPEDCHEIQLQNPESISGFYEISPLCVESSLKVYCEMPQGKTLFVNTAGLPPGTKLTSQISSPLSYISKCDEIHMSPYPVQDIYEGQRIQAVLKQMGFDKRSDNNNTNHNLVFPIGTISQGNLITTIDNKFSIGGLLLNNQQQLKPNSDTLAISWGPQVFDTFQWATSAVGGALCTVKQSTFDPSNVASITCDEKVRNNLTFQGCPFEWILVKCPDDCPSNVTVVGTGVYRDDSSVCGAAKHADGLGRYNIANVTFYPGLNAYSGSTHNGIRSGSYKGVVWDTSFSISKPLSSCSSSLSANNELFPKKTSNSSTPSPPLTTTSSPPAAVDDDDDCPRLLQKQPVLASNNSSRPINYSTGDAGNFLLELLRSAGFSSEAFESSIETAGTILSRLRSILKPAEILRQKTEDHSKIVEMELDESSEGMNKFKGEILTELQETQQREKSAANMFASIRGFKSYSLPDMGDSLLSGGGGLWKYFQVDSLRKHGNEQPSGGWSITANLPPLAERKKSAAITFMNLVDPNNEEAPPSAGLELYEESFLYVPNHSFYDGTLEVDFFSEEGAGSFGVLFRLRNNKNFYLYKIQSGEKSLLKIVDGVATIIASRQDGGYVVKTWYTIRINISMSTISVGTFPSGTPPEDVFVVNDGSVSQGTIGLVASNMKMIFDKFNFQASHCKEVGMPPPPPPKPPQCSIYRMDQVDSFKMQWHIVQPSNANVPSVWDYSRFAGVTQKTIVQYSSVIDEGDSYGAMAILKRNRFCTAGIWRADFLPQCQGEVGLIVHYESVTKFVAVEIGMHQSRIRQQHDGDTSTYLQVNETLGFVNNAWNQLEVEFDESNIRVLLNQMAIIETSIAKMSDGGRVGLFSRNCGGVAYDNISLYPHKFENKENPSVVENNNNWLLQYKSPPKECSMSTLEDRAAHCSFLFIEEGDISTCMYTYCDSCCTAHTESFGDPYLSCSTNCSKSNAKVRKELNQLNSKMKNCSKNKSDCHGCCSNSLSEPFSLFCGRHC